MKQAFCEWCHQEYNQRLKVQRFCSRACVYAARADLSPRFWSKVTKSDGCWLWTGAKDKDGYGGVQINGQKERAHRVAYILTNGPIPQGMFVCHKCDNPQCVRPDHLWLGDHKENVRDRNIKGRSARNNVKLTRQQVNEIRQRYSPRSISQSMLAKEYGVTKTNIRYILKGRTWQ